MLGGLRQILVCGLIATAGTSCVRAADFTQAGAAGPTADAPRAPGDLASDQPELPPDGAETPADLALDVRPPVDTAPLVDAPPEQGTAHADGPPASVACAAQATLRQVYSGSMVICGAAKGNKLDQCQAASLCSASWHLCAASEFLQRGGATEPAIVPGWIAGCVREGAAVTAPTDGICSSCTYSSTTQAEVSWPCGPVPGSPQTVTGYPLGLHSYQDCHSVGLFGPSTSAYWLVNGSQASYAAAVCCE